MNVDKYRLQIQAEISRKSDEFIFSIELDKKNTG